MWRFAMDKLTESELAAIKQALLSNAFQDLIGAVDWDLSEETEMELWHAIQKLEK
jgi:hypothetical protein